MEVIPYFVRGWTRDTCYYFLFLSTTQWMCFWTERHKRNHLTEWGLSLSVSLNVYVYCIVLCLHKNNLIIQHCNKLKMSESGNTYIIYIYYRYMYIMYCLINERALCSQFVCTLVYNGVFKCLLFFKCCCLSVSLLIICTLLLLLSLIVLKSI